MKSAYELAMEKLGGAVEYTEERKKKLAERREAEKDGIRRSTAR